MSRAAARVAPVDPGIMQRPVAGEAPEVRISRDLLRRGLIVAPLLVGLCWVIWGPHGAASSAYGVALVLVNFALAAGAIALSARISLSMMMAAILGGYLIRLGLIFLAVFAVRHTSWISLPALGATIIVTHLGLLVWEMKYLAITLAHPGLKPARTSPQDSHDAR